MKPTFTFLITSFTLLTFIACKKEVEHKSPIGHWIGTYSVIAGEVEADSLYYAYTLHPDSTLQMQSLGADGNTYYGLGRWSLRGTSFTATLTTSNFGQQGAVQHASGVLNGKELEGVVESADGPFKASFYFRKQ